MLSHYAKAQKQFDKKNYVVIADVKNAFGSILHDKMEKILKYVHAKLPSELYIYKLRDMAIWVTHSYKHSVEIW